MTRDDAIAIAKHAAWSTDQPHGYMPSLADGDAWKAWMPHEWVIAAIMSIADAQSEPVAWQCRFVSEGADGWRKCSREHHELVQANPGVWPGYETRAIYAVSTPPASEMRAGAWQPIETAPRDGSDVLLFEVYERLPVIGWWCEKKKRWYATTEVYDTDGDACVIDKLCTEGVTHWMPLPAAPVQSPA